MIGLVVAALSAAVLVGYHLGLEALHRPFADGPATHPLTALIIMLLGTAVTRQDNTFGNTIVVNSLAMTCVMLLLIRFLDIHHATEVHLFFSPFSADVKDELAAGKLNHMGVNTTAHLVLIAIALFMKSFDLGKWVLTLGLAASTITVIALTGYLLDLQPLYGQMSFYSATLLLLLGIAVSMGAFATILMDGNQRTRTSREPTHCGL